MSEAKEVRWLGERYLANICCSLQNQRSLDA